MFFFSLSRAVVILPLVIVVIAIIVVAFNWKCCYVGIYCNKNVWASEYEHEHTVSLSLFIPVPSCPHLLRSLIYWTWNTMNGYHSASCGKQSFSLSKWRISLSAKVWRSVGGVWSNAFFRKSLLTQLTRQTNWNDRPTQRIHACRMDTSCKEWANETKNTHK